MKENANAARRLERRLKSERKSEGNGMLEASYSSRYKGYVSEVQRQFSSLIQKGGIRLR